MLETRDAQVVVCKGCVLPMPFPGNQGSIHSPTSTPQRSWLVAAGQQLQSVRDGTYRIPRADSGSESEAPLQTAFWWMCTHFGCSAAS